MHVNADLHIHSKYSSGVSEKMDFKTLSVESEKKGIDLLGTGDCLHPSWRKNISKLDKERESIFSKKGMNFVLTGEVETKDRVHHLLVFPSISKVGELYERLSRFSSNLDSNGRPRVDLSGEELALMAKETGCLFGPSHAFTPYTGIYGNHDSLSSAYSKYSKKVHFLELGLSADSTYADKLSELHDLVYLSNSDAHSPFPHRLAREFNTLRLDELSFEGLKKLFEGKKGGVVQNVGLPPEEGKYNESACNSCYTHYSFQEAVSRDWRCRCGGSIKKGVKDRVDELADADEPPRGTPPYLAVIPLQEIIAKAVGHSSPNTKKVTALWEDLIRKIGDEVQVLTEAPVEKIKSTGGEEVAELIEDFRKENIEIESGGGGKYGKIVSKKSGKKRDGQRSLTDF
ncbi:MAG: endonuclease Q family protein [Candidatus Thermoplasmatota archaeon]